MIDVAALTNAVRLAAFDHLLHETNVPVRALSEMATSDERKRQFEAVAHQPGQDTLIRVTVEALAEMRDPSPPTERKP